MFLYIGNVTNVITIISLSDVLPTEVHKVRKQYWELGQTCIHNKNNNVMYY